MQRTHAHLLKRGVKCRLCWQVGMGVCRRGAGPNIDSTFVCTFRTPATWKGSPGHTHTAAVQVISGCFQSFRWTPPPPLRAPLGPQLQQQSCCSWGLFSLGARECRGVQNPGLLSLLGAGNHLGLQPQLHSPRCVHSAGEWQLPRHHADPRWLPRVFPRPETLAWPDSGTQVPGASAVPALAVRYSRLSVLT